MLDQGQTTESETVVSPPWGSFPAEQYLIRCWDFSSTLSATEQRLDLIRAFVQLDAIPKEWDATGRSHKAATPIRVPTEHEVQEILAPWRPLHWRNVALYLWRDRDDEEVWLRTHYDKDSDERFRKMREIAEDYDPAFNDDCRDWTVLDDRTVFEDDWSAVLDILPELAGPIGYDAYSHRHLGNPETLEILRRELRKSVDLALRLGGEGNNAEQLKIDDMEAGPMGMELQASMVASFIFVADTEAFETGKLRLLYLDARGNIVRETRLPYTETWEMRDGWNAKKFRGSNLWNDRERSEWPTPSNPGSVLGMKYKISGEIGSKLYELDEP